MHQTQSCQNKAKCIKRRKDFMSSVKGVSHFTRRAKRRLYCKLQLWMWRKRREQCRFGLTLGKKLVSGSFGTSLTLKTHSRKSKIKVPNVKNSEVSHSALASPVGCASEDSADTPRGQNVLLTLCESAASSESCMTSKSLHSRVTETSNFTISQTPTTGMVPSQGIETFSETTENPEPSLAVRPLKSKDGGECGLVTHFLHKKQRTMIPAAVKELSGQHTAASQGLIPDSDDRITSKNTRPQTDIGLNALVKEIQEFLNDFYRIYGSFIPLQMSDVLRHLKRRFNMDFKDRKNLIYLEVTKYRSAVVQKPVPSFRVVFKKHTLTLDDLSTLADQNWLNDQVMNMYGELIMDCGQHKVHFLNSFFHRQLMTKGYEGVKRWTKQVDLFSKNLLLVPIHLEVHWCLVTADIVKKKICLYDSQGNALQKVARNILKYLMAEAKEKQQTAFEDGWTASFDEKVPQQTNENDCGVFVLEYSRCLALAQPLQFSQEDIPKIRKRIYKELCDCQLHSR
ncbi:sentrin-specific protease 5-like isoform 2-T3 [Aulostomus maculatus]